MPIFDGETIVLVFTSRGNMLAFDNRDYPGLAEGWRDKFPDGIVYNKRF